MKKFILFLASMVVLIPSYSFGEGTDGASTNQKIVIDEIINPLETDFYTYDALFPGDQVFNNVIQQMFIQGDDLEES